MVPLLDKDSSDLRDPKMDHWNDSVREKDQKLITMTAVFTLNGACISLVFGAAIKFVESSR